MRAVSARIHFESADIIAAKSQVLPRLAQPAVKSVDNQAASWSGATIRATCSAHLQNASRRSCMKSCC